jgi:hypothetical protein
MICAIYSGLLKAWARPRVNGQKSPDIADVKRGRNLFHLIDSELFAYL